MKNIDFREINDVDKIINGLKLNEKFSERKLKYEQLSVKEGNTDDVYDKWLRYVKQHQKSEVFNHPLWIKALEYEYGRKAIVLYCEDEHSVMRGVLPLISTLGIPFKKGEPIAAKRLASLPRTPVGGLLYDDNKVCRLLIEGAVGKVKEYPKTLLQLKSYDNNLNENSEGLYKFPWRSSYYVQLSKFPESMRFGNKKHHYDRKREVAKAKKSGLYIREASSEDDLKKWYSLYTSTMRWHAVPARPFRFFNFLRENMEPENMFTLLLAESKEGSGTVLHAGSIFLKYNDTISYSFNGRNTTAFLNHANDYIQWEIIHRSCKEGFKFYDMGEASDNNAGLSKFKAKWGCLKKQIYHYYYPQGHNLKNNNIDILKDPGIYKKIWRKLPLTMTKNIGVMVNHFL